MLKYFLIFVFFLILIIVFAMNKGRRVETVRKVLVLAAVAVLITAVTTIVLDKT